MAGHSTFANNIKLAFNKAGEKSDVDEAKAIMVDLIAKAIVKYFRECKETCYCKDCPLHLELGDTGRIYLMLVQQIAIAFDVVSNGPEMTMQQIQNELANRFTEMTVMAVQICRSENMCEQYSGQDVLQQAYQALRSNVKRAFKDSANASTISSSRTVMSTYLAQGIGIYIDACNASCRTCLRDQGGRGKKKKKKAKQSSNVFIQWREHELILPWYVTKHGEFYSALECNDAWCIEAVEVQQPFPTI